MNPNAASAHVRIPHVCDGPGCALPAPSRVTPTHTLSTFSQLPTGARIARRDAVSRLRSPKTTGLSIHHRRDAKMSAIRQGRTSPEARGQAFDAGEPSVDISSRVLVDIDPPSNR